MRPIPRRPDGPPPDEAGRAAPASRALRLPTLAARVLGAVVARPLRKLTLAVERLTEPGEPASAPAGPHASGRGPRLASTAHAAGAAARKRRKLLDFVMRAQEEERHRIARDLHDELGGSLSALLMDIRARRRECVEPDQLPAHWAGLEDQLTDLIRRVRQMAWSLRPAVLDDHGLHSALAQHGAALAEATGLDVDVCCADPEEATDRLPPEVELCLYRVAQEALANAVQHARAQRVSVIVMRRPGAVTLLVEDDGQGFEARDALAREEHLGLLGMLERVEAAGGNLVIASAEGRGTTVRATLPLPGPPP